jgi:serine protease AprX
MRVTPMLVRVTTAALLIVSGAHPAHAEPVPEQALAKIGRLAKTRIPLVTASSRVIVRAVDGQSPGALVSIIANAGGHVRRTLPLINAQVVDLPNAAITLLADSALVSHINLDRRVAGTMERTGAAIGATAVRQALGYDGAGVGVAIIDSGATAWHDDLADAGGTPRVRHFVDFVNDGTASYDDYGHGTHVAGIIAGGGHDSGGARSGIAPAAHLMVLKALDANGNGYISDVIAALDYVVVNKDAFNIRVVNCSVAAGVYESYNSDPLTIAAKRVVDAGIVVVAAAGNAGRTAEGVDAYGGVTAPGNAPWVLTVGASSHMGTIDRADDTMAAFSSRGPSAVDYSAKPDVVAPGVGIESLSAPGSTLYATRASSLLDGTVAAAYLPYLSLSGTSMAAPVVSGTVALMLQANPALTPNQVKAILQYTAQVYSSYDPLTEGAGFLNANGAVQLAHALAASPAGVQPVPSEWSGRLIWGNRLVSGGRLTADANAWTSAVTWGAGTTATGEQVAFGAICPSGTCEGGGGTWDAWTVDGAAANVVWGSACGGADCEGPWTIPGATSVESVVWGTTDPQSVVWGTGDDDSVVWGTTCSDSACEPVVWPRP